MMYREKTKLNSLKVWCTQHIICSSKRISLVVFNVIQKEMYHYHDTFPDHFHFLQRKPQSVPSSIPLPNSQFQAANSLLPVCHSVLCLPAPNTVHWSSVACMLSCHSSVSAVIWNIAFCLCIWQLQAFGVFHTCKIYSWASIIIYQSSILI